MSKRVHALLSVPALTGLLLLAAPASAVTIDWVTVGDPGNPADDTASNCFAANCGSVADPYRISKYEVTNSQYAEFLNAVDPTGANLLGLYDPDMGSSPQGGIDFVPLNATGAKYVLKAAVIGGPPGFGDKPVNYVSFYDSLRFANWLNNGQGSADTESGAYTLLGGTETPSNGTTVTRNLGANIFLPSENEWYKAAYYAGPSGGYFDYPTGTNVPTACALPGATPNTANCASAVSNLTDVGAYSGSASPYGTFDQGGNVMEWNEEGLSFGLQRGLRGGSFSDVGNSLAASWPDSGTATTGRNERGFRVASVVPEPGTGLLLMTGLAGLAARRRQ